MHGAMVDWYGSEGFKKDHLTKNSKKSHISEAAIMKVH